MTKKTRLYIIEKCIDIVKFLKKNEIISKQTAINWIWNITSFFGKKEE